MWISMREFIMHFCCPSSVVRVRMYVWMCMCAAREMKRNLAVLTKKTARITQALNVILCLRTRVGSPTTIGLELVRNFQYFIFFQDRYEIFTCILCCHTVALPHFTWIISRTENDVQIVLNVSLYFVIVQSKHEIINIFSFFLLYIAN